MIQPYSDILGAILSKSPKLRELTLMGEQRGDIQFSCPKHVVYLDIHGLRSTYVYNKKTESYLLKIKVENPRAEVLDHNESERY